MMGLLVFMIISISGKTESSNSGTSQSIFLSCAERFAPPGDILLEEPDASNPGFCRASG